MTQAADLIGQRITNVRPMTDRELSREDWESATSDPIAIEVEDGTVIYASQDQAGDAPGVLFRAGENNLYRVVAEN